PLNNKIFIKFVKIKNIILAKINSIIYQNLNKIM
ncbi:hypothetical protein cco5_06702, partial [Campylobacter coli 132-6]